MENNQQSQTAGAAGPILMQDHALIEKLAHFDRERIPERVVHARGSAAYGVFAVTHDVTKWTKAKFLASPGKKTETFLRFSTVALELGSADTVRDPRGFALKFYTEDGNYDLVGNNTPIFFIRDPLKFPDFIHSQKRDPYTHVQEPNNAWDFFSHSPEATHQFTWLFGDRGIPESYPHLDGHYEHCESRRCELEYRHSRESGNPVSLVEPRCVFAEVSPRMGQGRRQYGGTCHSIR